jgi:hypothetical protein
MDNNFYLDLLMEYQFLSCPRCSDGIFSDDELAFELLTMLGLPDLLCLFCGFQYHASFYLDNDLYFALDAVRGELDS